MPKVIESDYADELEQQLDAWNRKAGLRCVYTKIEISDILVYPATGGFSYSNLLPASVVAVLHPLERSWTPRWIADRLGLRMLVVIQKR